MINGPIVGSVVNGKQSLTLRTKDGGREFLTTPEKVDEFLDQRKKCSSETNKRALIWGGICGLIAGVIPLFTKEKAAAIATSILGAAIGAFAALGVGGHKLNKLEQQFINAHSDN